MMAALGQGDELAPPAHPPDPDPPIFNKITPAGLSITVQMTCPAFVITFLLYI